MDLLMICLPLCYGIGMVVGLLKPTSLAKCALHGFLLSGIMVGILWMLIRLFYFVGKSNGSF